MRVRKFIEDIEKMLPCKTIYYPREQQVVVFINVNNKDVTLCYDEAFIENNWNTEVFKVVEDDLFRIGSDVNTGKIYEKNANHVSIGTTIQDIVMIVLLQKVNGRMHMRRIHMSTETIIIFICGMFAGVLMEFIISAVVIMKGEK